MSKKPEILILAVSNIDLPSVKTEVKDIRENLQKAKNYVLPDEKLNFDYNTLDHLLSSNSDSNQITMLHYTGHSEEAGILVNQNGVEKILVINSLKKLVESHKKFRFIFLNSCYSESIAQQLIDVGVPYVIGTKGKVGDADASIVAAKFYEYLGKNSFTIEETYNKTKDYFFENPDKLRIDGDFRSLTTSDEEEENNVWKLFFDKDNLTQEQKDWTLIPRDNLILSRKENEDKIKIFCIYGDDEKSLEFYKNFSIYSETGNPNQIVNGSLNISRTFKEKSFLVEYDVADIIVNLVTKSFLSYIENNNILIIIENFKDKKHCYLPLYESLEILNNKPWINQSLILKPEPEAHIRISGLDFYDMKRTTNFDDNFEAFHKSKFESILYSRESLLLKDTLLDIPISQFKQKIYQTDEKIFYHSIIEGSQNCGLKLVVNQFKSKVLKSNIPPFLVTFQTKKVFKNEKLLETEKVTETENQIIDQIANPEAFWIALYTQLSTGGGSKIINTPDKYLTECLELIIGKMFDEKAYSDVFLIFDEVNKDLHNTIINSFWEKIIEEFEKNIDSYKKLIKEFEIKNKDNDQKYPGKLYVFSINNYFIDESQKLKTFNSLSNSFEPINYSPLNPITETEFNDEWKNLKKHSNTKFISYNTILDNGQPPKPLIAIKNICENAKEKHIYAEIEKILNN